MNDVRETLWSAFFSEVGEQLQDLELVLVKGDGATAADVNVLFRYFHTIKSSSAMMAFTGMESLAHASEDVLDFVRRGELSLGPTLVDLLLKSVDELKQQLAYAAEKRASPPASPALLEALRAIRPGAGPAVAAPEARAAADADVSAVLEGFAASCREHLAHLMITPAGPQPEVFHAALRAIVSASAFAGFQAVVRLLTKLEQAHEAAGEDSTGDIRQIRSQIMDRLRHVEQASKVDCGIAAVERQIAASSREALRRDLEGIIAAVNDLKNGAAGGNSDSLVEAASRAHSRVESILSYTRLLGLVKSTALMNVVRQALRDLGRGRLQASEALLDVLAITVTLPFEICGDDGESQHYVAMCDETMDEFQSVLRDGVGEGDITTKLRQIRTLIDMPQEYLDLLTPRAVTQLLEVLSRRGQVVEIEADLESYPAIGERFVGWIHGNGQVISNRTVFHRRNVAGRDVESSRLRFLVELAVSVEELKLELGRLDPERKLFELHQTAYRDALQAEARPAAHAVTGSAEAAAPSQLADTVRIDSTTLDNFVTRIGEMVTLGNIVTHSLSDDSVQSGVRRGRGLVERAGGKGSLDSAAIEELGSIFASLEERYDRFLQSDLRMQNSLKRLQQDVLDLRVVPVSLIFNRMPRVVRSVSQAHGKDVHVRFEGEQSRIDKSMIELLTEPLMHIVRNSVDHGIETPDERRRAGKAPTANLLLAARQQGNSMVIEVRDDGRGLDYEKIRRQAVKRGLVAADRASSLSESELKNFIFMPGFSTAESVTETSGRGVGMDVVRTRVVSMGGQIEVTSVPGEGAAFHLRLPLTVAIQGVILVSAGSQSVAIPERNVAEVATLPRSKLQSVRGQVACLLRGSMLPVFRLSHLLGAASAVSEGEQVELIVLSNGTHRIGLLVDAIASRQEAFVRDLPPALSAVPGVSGTSILGNGRIAVIADVDQLMELARKRSDRLYELSRAT